MEPEREAMQETKFGVGGLDEALGQAVLERGIDLLAVSADPLLQRDKRGDAAALRPRAPAVQQHADVGVTQVDIEDRP